ncbi:MAG: sulfite exporter TauE/SafE family protein, partial [Candidatus Thermoplasmatota archaeon]|nr:sulfite exporter TauE/SafE family protein [Candidatus Thermoplasmatota archaeon]
AAATAIGVLIGSYLGAKILVRITNKDIRWLFFAILSFLGIEMLLKGLYLGKYIVYGPTTEIYISSVSAVLMIVGLYLHQKRGDIIGKTV